MSEPSSINQKTTPFIRFTGHPSPHYHKEETSLLNSVDCVIFGFYGTELHLLLHRFPYEPLVGHWALLGGFVHPEESIDDAARKTVQRLTGLQDVYMEQVYTFGDVYRVPTDRVITTCYYALIEVEPTLDKLSHEYGATWQPISEVLKLDLVYDHFAMFQKALEQLRRKVRYQPIGFELLPEKFTMLELRNLYASILGRSLDKRNFSKKILNMNLLVKLKEKQKGTSRRGAYFFCFDEKRYQELVAKGFLFEI
ncbi:NUDIX hydrolase [Runella sp.]|uniref:NUDIX hydrolase n=1 Tax=Runella sp. TaxID=1960881 RepID=UPI003D0ED759